MDQVAVANLALGWLGCDRITQFENPTQKTEQLLADQFEGLRDACLEDRDWTFATSRLQLAADPDAPAFDYGVRFLLPSTVLRVVRVTLGAALVAEAVPPVLPAPLPAQLDAFAAQLRFEDGLDDTIDWRREGQYIVTEAGVGMVNVKAIVQVVDSMLWTPGFCQALAARIAADLCISITGDRALQLDLWKLYEAKLKGAAGNDGRQGRSEVIRTSTLARRRR